MLSIDSVDLRTKGERVLAAVARDLASRRVGERLPTVGEYRRLLHAGSGTIQRVFLALESVAAVAIDRRGHLGSVLVGKDLPRLLGLAGTKVLTGCLPFVNSREFQGLASGFRAVATRLDLPISLTYVHGAENRFQALLEGKVHFCLASQMAVAAAIDRHKTLLEALTLPANTYYAERSVVVLARADLHELRDARFIGIDRSSPDHRVLTEHEFPGASYREIQYLYIPRSIHEGLIDAAVWHRTVLPLPLEQIGLKVYPLQLPLTVELSERMSVATVATRADDGVIGEILRLFDVDEIVAIQRKVVDFELTPVF